MAIYILKKNSKYYEALHFSCLAAGIVLENENCPVSYVCAHSNNSAKT